MLLSSVGEDQVLHNFIVSNDDLSSQTKNTHPEPCPSERKPFIFIAGSFPKWDILCMVNLSRALNACQVALIAGCCLERLGRIAGSNRDNCQGEINESSISDQVGFITGSGGKVQKNPLSATKCVMIVWDLGKLAAVEIFR